MDDETLRKLFGNATTATAEEKAFGDMWKGLIAMNAGADSGKDMLAKAYLLRLITAILLRVSLVASVWLFVFDPSKWVGMLLFFLLAAMFGGVQPFSPSAKQKTSK